MNFVAFKAITFVFIYIELLKPYELKIELDHEL